MEDSIFLRADEIGIRLEIVGGLPIWESHPPYRHQRAIDRIRHTIEKLPQSDTNCACLHIDGVYINFPDGSVKRPDIAIFCQEPEEQDEMITLVPEAVIEVVSKGYEAKDLEIGPRFYLSQGVKDVVVFDPYTLLVLHVRQDGVTRRIFARADKS
jgi:Uma2 family endonuclease